MDSVGSQVQNFHRTYVLTCGRAGEEGFQIGNIHSPTEITPHIAFSVEKSDVESPNTSTIQVWNLSNQSLKYLAKKDVVAELKAGYGNNMALIIVGTVTSVKTSLDDADRLTEIDVVDGRVELRDTNVSVSISGSVNAKTVYDFIADKMGLSIRYANDLVFVSYPNGYSFVGKARNALQRIANSCNHVWSIQNGVIQVTIPGRPIGGTSYELNPQSGLLGVPKEITIGDNSQEKNDMTGYEIRYLLNGSIGVNDIVRIKTSTINGYYRIHKVKFEGDNIEDDWVCTAEVLAIPDNTKATESMNSTKAENI